MKNLFSSIFTVAIVAFFLFLDFYYLINIPITTALVLSAIPILLVVALSQLLKKTNSW